MMLSMLRQPAPGATVRAGRRVQASAAHKPAPCSQPQQPHHHLAAIAAAALVLASPIAAPQPALAGTGLAQIMREGKGNGLVTGR